MTSGHDDALYRSLPAAQCGGLKSTRTEVEREINDSSQPPIWLCRQDRAESQRCFQIGSKVLPQIGFDLLPADWGMLR